MASATPPTNTATANDLNWKNIALFGGAAALAIGIAVGVLVIAPELQKAKEKKAASNATA